MSFIALGLLIGSVILFIGFIIISRFSYAKRFKQDYHFRNYYPYELNYNGKFKDNLLGFIPLIISLILYAVFFVIFDTTRTDGYYIFSCIAGVILSVVIAGIIFTPLKNIKTHLAFFVLLVTFTFLLPTAIGIKFIQTYKDMKNIAQLVVGIISLLFALIVVGIMFNPKLSRWANVDVQENEDGTKTYIRPRYFVLALSEWILMAIAYIVPFLLVIATAICK